MGHRMGQQERVARAVRASPVLGRLRAEELTKLLGPSRSVHVDRGHRFRQAHEDALTILLEGVAVASVPSPAGAEVMTRILGPGGTTGLRVVLGQTSASIDLTALTSVEALVVPGESLRRCLGDLPALTDACLRSLAEELAEAMDEIARFANTTTTERVLDRLIELADAWGEPTVDGIRITIPLTQEMLASWARSSRESTAKVLHDLRKSDVIRTARREMHILDPDRLRARRGDTPAASSDELLRSLLRSIG